MWSAEMFFFLILSVQLYCKKDILESFEKYVDILYLYYCDTIIIQNWCVIL